MKKSTASKKLRIDARDLKAEDVSGLITSIIKFRYLYSGKLYFKRKFEQPYRSPAPES